MPIWCVLKMYNPFLITDGPFSRPAEWKLSSSWKICSPTGLTKRLTWQITEKLGCGRGPSCQPLHVQYSSDGMLLTTLTMPRREHQGGGWRWGLGRGRHGAGEDAAVDAHTERSTRVHWFGCGVRLPSPSGLASGGSSRGDEASSTAQPTTGGRSRRSPRHWFGRLVQEEQRLKK